MKYSLTLTDLEHTPDLLQESAWMEICSWKKSQNISGSSAGVITKIHFIKKSAV